MLVILGDLGRERRELGDTLRRERDADTPALRQEASPIASAERRLKALEHRATRQGFARQVLGARVGRQFVETRYLEVRDTTTTFARTARYAYWVTGYDGHHTGLSRDEALDVLAGVAE